MGHDIININTCIIIDIHNNKIKRVNDNEPIQTSEVNVSIARFDCDDFIFINTNSKTVHCIGNLGTLMRPCMKSVMITQLFFFS